MLIDAIITLGLRTVTRVLHIMGRPQERWLMKVHRIINQVAQCPRSSSHILLWRLVEKFAQRGSMALELEDPIERSRCKRIAAKGIYLDPFLPPRWLIPRFRRIVFPLKRRRGFYRIGSGGFATAATILSIKAKSGCHTNRKAIFWEA